MSLTYDVLKDDVRAGRPIDFGFVTYVPERTCRPEVCDDGAGAWGVYCSECGYRFAGPYGKREVPEHMATRRDIMPRYCPYCGARVEVKR